MSDQPRMLDLYSGAGGAAMGYHRAGFKVITGVDNQPMPRYPFEFHRGDALEFLTTHGAEFDAVHASPPCQDHSRLRHATKRVHGTGGLLADTRSLLEELGVPWVIENVPGAPMRPDYVLCGCMFGLPFGLQRPRWFETSWHGFSLHPPCHHNGPAIAVAGHGTHGREYLAGRRYTQADRQAAMGIDWMNRDELAQAIPPAFTEYIGGELLAVLGRSAGKARVS